MHLGYRKPLSGAGRWLARHYIGHQAYEVETIATADDFSDPDGVAILSFGQAQTLARSRMVARAHTAVGKTKPLTVKDAIDNYTTYLESKRSRSGREARYAADAFILPVLGAVEINALTPEQVRSWLSKLAKAPARIRTKKGEQQQFKTTDDPENQRRRQSSANRILTILKAALNLCAHDHPKAIPSDAAWRRVKPFKGVDAARVRFLTMKEAERLLNACEPDFRRLVRGALETGARYGELCALAVADFYQNSGTVEIRQSKSDKPRHIVLTADGVDFFRDITKGRIASDPLFVRGDGEAWLASWQKDPIAEASKAAKIEPPINFHGLRHTWASHAVMNGVPLMVVAKNLGHSTTRMVEKHYGHLAPSFVADAIRSGAPRFGKTSSNVESIG
ncbi:MULTISPECIES: tyrosine-type recombinase/integrase [Bradyrhizobium]|uniref:tyrosine-type recombinase/integrase n=1 Tax=Bradyrhizobium elkanii TaxID=29448 RepID=UPI00271465DE|nr:site-specific integrase [Bradyrhizobium elkanii]WLB84909.1 site-specific integrase [Bradyrhizobium elkanii]